MAYKCRQHYSMTVIFCTGVRLKLNYIYFPILQQVRMKLMWIGCFFLSVLLQARDIYGLPRQLERQGNIEDGDTHITHESSEQQDKEPKVEHLKAFKTPDHADEWTEYLPEPVHDRHSKIRPKSHLERIVRSYIRKPQIPEMAGNAAAGAKRAYSKTNKPQLLRVKRNQGIDYLPSDIADTIEGVCLTNECVQVLKEYMEWRKQNGYPAYTGVTNIG